MRIDVIPIKELPEKMKQEWFNVQISNPDLAGPCFHPELFCTVGEFCPEIYLALLHYNKNSVAFLPFLRNKDLLMARPIDFCDYQAIIGPANQRWNINEILRKIGLNSWELEALAGFKNVSMTRGDACKISESKRVDLSGGLEGYISHLKQKKVELDGLMVKKKELERKIGPVRFMKIENDIKTLHRLLDWKVMRHNCDLNWERLAKGVLEHTYSLKGLSFSGVLFGLYAGDELLAAQFCLKHQGIMQALVMSFNPAYSKYSPGKMVLYYLISELQLSQCNVLDFGPGDELYKLELSNSSIPIMTGKYDMVSFKEKINPLKLLKQKLFKGVN